MTLAEIRTAIHNIIKEQETDAGALLPSDNVMMDFWINHATEFVVLDLVEFMPEMFVTYEDITLVANQATYTLTAEWLQIWNMSRNVADKSQRPIEFIRRTDEAYKQYKGQTAEDPVAWTWYGTTIEFIPTPSSAKTTYARCWIVATEAATVPATGPAYIPRIGHILIPYMAATLIAEVNESSKMNTCAAIYRKMLTRVTDVYSSVVQQQPKFLGPSWMEKKVISTLDPALYDLGSPFED